MLIPHHPTILCHLFPKFRDTLEDLELRISLKLRMSAQNESPREDTAGSHQRADERYDDLSSILEFTRNEVDEGRVL